MIEDVSILFYVLLILTGLAAGAINTLAGGGSNLTLPVLMVMGLPPEIANATNRLGVFLQCITGALGFKKHKRLDTEDILPILWPTMTGAAIGSIAASFSPSWILKPLLLGAMLLMALIILVRPSVVAPEPGTPSYKVKDRPLAAWLSLGIAGFYGGFVQAGVGFILIAALAGTLRYDLVRTNALKAVSNLALVSVALAVFIARGQVLWLPGLILGAGFMVGAHYAVKFALKAKQTTLKWFLFVMTLAGCTAAMIF